MRDYNQLDMYSAQLLEFFQSSANAGDLPGANARSRIENPVCGDIVEFAASILDGSISEIRFRAKGCVPAMACAAALCHMVKGQTVQKASQLALRDLEARVGGVPPGSSHALQMSIEGLRQLLRSAAAINSAQV